jgi:hypothetical protein
MRTGLVQGETKSGLLALSEEFRNDGHRVAEGEEEAGETDGMRRERRTALAVCSLLFLAVIGGGAETPEQRTSRYFESIRNQPLLLLAFVRDMPKGGDLHNHLVGAVYAESYISFAARDGLCVDRATATLLAPPCHSERGQVPAAAALGDPTLYGQMIDVYSMRDFQAGQQSAHDHFFDAFLKFDAATQAHHGEMLAEVVSRAAAQHALYLELMLGPGRAQAMNTAAQTGWDEDLARLRDNLMTHGIGEAVSGAKVELDQDEKKMREVLRCDASPEGLPIGKSRRRDLDPLTPGPSPLKVRGESKSRSSGPSPPWGRDESKFMSPGPSLRLGRWESKLRSSDPSPPWGRGWRGAPGEGVQEPEPIPQPREKEGHAAGCGVTVRYVYDVLRGLPPEQVFAQMLLACELARIDPRMVAVNLVMPEDAYIPMRDFHLHMRMLDYLHGVYPQVHITLHAGELAPGLVPPESLRFHIRESVEKGHAERIGHGVDVMYEDHPLELLREMAGRKVLVEICLTSNDMILGVRGMEHPLPLYLRYGVPVALATDDEGVARSSLTWEYKRAVETYRLTYAQLKRMARDSIEHSFLPGTSLWSDREHSVRVPACSGATPNRGTLPPACGRVLERSEKARLEWRLEGEFDRFEKNF